MDFNRRNFLKGISLTAFAGAAYRVGHEARSEFGEEFGIEKSDRKTMGSSLLIQARETDHKVEFTPPERAYDFPDDESLIFAFEPV